MNPPDVAHRRRSRAALVAALTVPALLLSACGGADDEEPRKASASPSVDLPTGDVEVPSGTTLTKAGTELEFGKTATVAYEPNSAKGSVLALRVDSVRTGTIADFSGYQLDARTKQSRPYYVRVTVRNAGDGDLGRSPVPLLAVDSRDTLVQPSTFDNTFERCPSTPLPASFGAGKTYRGCLVYLIPAGGKVTAISYRPLQAFEPITWTGTIAPAGKTKPAKKKNG